MLETNYDIDNDDLVFMNSIFDINDHKIYLKMYNTRNNKLYLIEDRSCFKPFFYIKKDELDTKLLTEFLKENNGAFELVTKTLYDGIYNKEIECYRFNTSNIFNAYRRWNEKLGVNYQYEYLIKFYESYYLSNSIIPCGIYNIKGGMLYEKEIELPENAKITLEKMLSHVDKDNEKYAKYLKEYTYLLSQPVPDIRRCALDIEVAGLENKVPDVSDPVHPIVMVSFCSSDGYTEVFALKSYFENKHTQGELSFNIQLCDTEQEIIEKIWSVCNEYPMILTYNGDDFDLAYVFSRSRLLKMNVDNSPILFNLDNLKKGTSFKKDPAILKNSIHLDLYRMFANKSLHTYAFNNKYDQVKLDTVAKAFLNEGKIEHGKMSEMSLKDMAWYCYVDSNLTLRLTQFNDNMVMKLLFTVSRITKSTIEDICRYGMSNWVRSMLYFEHRKNNILIPHKDELKYKTKDEELLKIYQDYGKNYLDLAKRYEGGFVMNPVSGTHFNVTVLDFASLYPSIIKTRNLSYETINCDHEECKQNNKVPETKNWYCNKMHGMTSLIIGVLRDLRVEYFKKLSKDQTLSEEQRLLYDAITQSQKVILNGTYGVIGQSTFQLFCLPVAESITAIGRNIIKSTKQYAEQELGLKVLYGDTDSVFILNPDQKSIDDLINFTRENYQIDLEVDKEFKYVIFSDRKKNYFGIYKNGKIETKGLTAKKSNIPEYIKRCYNEVTTILSKIETKNQIETSIDKIKELINNYIKNMKSGKYDIKEMAFNIKLRAEIEEYGEVEESTDIFGNNVKSRKGVPEHIRILEELRLQGVEINKGDFISFIKGKHKPMIVDKATKSNIDIDKYIQSFETAFKPILSVLGVDFKEVIGGDSRQTSLSDIFFK